MYDALPDANVKVTGLGVLVCVVAIIAGALVIVIIVLLW